MEKRKAHYNLDEIKKLIKNGNVKITGKASFNAENDFSLNKKAIIQHVLDLEPINIYKSMTANFNNHLWQDVYHKTINKDQTAYIKLQILDENTVIIQFKKK